MHQFCRSRHKPLAFLGLSFSSFALSFLFASAIQANDAAPACVPEVTQATYSQPTRRYAHAVLGDDIEYGAMKILMQVPQACTGKQTEVEIELPHSLVFEDLSPRLIDVSGDNKPEIITIESSLTHGARLSVWGISENKPTRLASTPFIGTAYRWLAPIGAADLDNDGFIEIAYIDRPHLAKLLKVWRYKDGTLTLVAQQSGLSNHRIGEAFISGGIRECKQNVEMITANDTWSKVMATYFDNGKLTTRILRNYTGQSSFDDALGCKASDQ